MELETATYTNGNHGLILSAPALTGGVFTTEGTRMSTTSALEAYRQSQLELRRELDNGLTHLSAIAVALGLGSEVGILQGGIKTEAPVQAGTKGRRASRELVGSGIGQDDTERAAKDYPVVTGRAAGDAPKTRAPRAAKRSSEDVQATLDQVVGLIKSKCSSLRAENIREGLGVDKAELTLALKLGVSTGVLTVTGKKRATAYDLAADVGDSESAVES